MFIWLYLNFRLTSSSPFHVIDASWLKLDAEWDKKHTIDYLDFKMVPHINYSYVEVFSITKNLVVCPNVLLVQFYFSCILKANDSLSFYRVSPLHELHMI